MSVPELVKWVKDDKNRASNVRPFVKRAPRSRHTGFAERDYTDGLIQREDGLAAMRYWKGIAERLKTQYKGQTAALWKELGLLD